MLSVYYNHYEICSFLLEFGCDVNLSSDNGLNAYRLAVQHNRTRILYLLIDFGAVVEENDS
jgi:ankyrin repeat protein